MAHGTAEPEVEEDREPPWVPGPGAVLWERGGDLRLLLVAGRSLLLQVAHPTVAAGVAQHSDYASDPWGRLRGTLDLYVAGVNFGYPDGALAAAGRLRRMHRRIEGIDLDGRPYHALDPEPFAWVHATLVDGLLLMLSRYVGGVGAAELDRAYAEMRLLGGLYGIPEELMPADRRGHEELVAATVAERLADNEVVRNVLAQISRPPPPSYLRLAGPLWSVSTAAPGRVLRLATVGGIPPLLRERLELDWSAAEERELELYARLVRRAAPLLPERLRLLPKVYAAKRRAGSAAGEAARPAAA